jgi:hypothetical protein
VYIYSPVFPADMQENVEYTLISVHIQPVFPVEMQEKVEYILFSGHIQPCIPCGNAGEYRVHTVYWAYIALYSLWKCRRM